MLSFFRYMIFRDHINPDEFYHGRNCKYYHSYVISRNSLSDLYIWSMGGWATFDKYGWEFAKLPLFATNESDMCSLCKNIVCNKIARIMPL